MSAFKAILWGVVGTLATAAALYALLMLLDLRLRVIDTHEKTTLVFCRVYPERCQPVAPPPVATPPANASPPAPSK